MVGLIGEVGLILRVRICVCWFMGLVCHAPFES
jgi:hypothetical protein